ncbi:hypothetical protein ELG63_36450 [Rhizobium leguminosarum]|uniref:hypothetical protein n=1 Tax=Rhizobium leguminosarum TaxID=384 RepID=UPI00102F8537|nr:hypothetical protein [Rhizobium leguminosarum]TBH28181.1 hypothetical protein ELG63_36450 [Rhizobium leguminosarum]
MATAAKKVEAQSSTGLFVIMASDKGGVGKSFFFRFLAEFLRKQKDGVLLFDGDGGTGSSFRIFGKRDNDGFLLDDQDPAVGIKPYNLRKSRPRETLINSATLGGSVTMHDLPGGSFDAISEIVDGGGESLHGIFDGIISVNQKPVVFHLVHHEDESTESVARFLDATEGLDIVHIAVLNYRDAEAKEDFEMWYGFENHEGEREGGRTRERLLATGGFEIVVPRLMLSAASRIKRNNLLFSEAGDKDNPKSKLLTLAQRAQVDRWYRQMVKALTDTEKATNPQFETAKAFKALFGL